MQYRPGTSRFSHLPIMKSEKSKFLLQFDLSFDLVFAIDKSIAFNYNSYLVFRNIVANGRMQMTNKSCISVSY